MESLKNFLLALGIPGVIVIAAVDSAGVPMAGGPDAVVMLVSWQNPALTVFVALAAALGSVIGCYILYLVGEKGGEVALSRFEPSKKERVMGWLRRNDVLTIFIAVIGPPPFPTKLFILGAGVIRMPWKRFVAAIFAGRFLRYLGEGYLGARFGDHAAEILKSYYPAILITLLVGAALFVVARHFLGRRQEDPI
jgi:membrane protein YqaA with SNARE-associated domain